ncbi:MAG TPA: response regulator transcription factor [Candidatus Obscuribacterales bacterium]
MGSGQEITVLVVDDEPLLRIGLVNLIEQNNGFKVIGQAADGDTAVELAVSLCPRLVLMDIHIPGMNGIEATKRIKEERPETRVLIVSAFDDDDDIVAAVAAGMDGYCLKSLSGDELIQAARTVAFGGAWINRQIAEKVMKAYGRLHASAAAPPVESIDEPLLAANGEPGNISE